MKTYRTAALAAVALCLAAGCASRQVVSRDRAALWNAAMQAMQEQGFETLDADRSKGEIVATVDRPPGTRTGVQRLRVTIGLDRPAEGEYRARVYARRSLGEDQLTVIDDSVRFNKDRIGTTGRSLGQYGSVATRDTSLEKTIVERMRDLLAGAASPLTRSADEAYNPQ